MSAQDYYPFGMLQPGRSIDVSGYRYGFNGKEMDNEVKGDGDQLDYGMRKEDKKTLGKIITQEKAIGERNIAKPGRKKK